MFLATLNKLNLYSLQEQFNPKAIKAVILDRKTSKLQIAERTKKPQIQFK